MECLASPKYQTGACQCEPWKRKIKCHSIGIMISKSNHTKQDSHPSLLDVGAGIRVSTTANADLGRIFLAIFMLILIDVDFDLTIRVCDWFLCWFLFWFEIHLHVVLGGSFQNCWNIFFCPEISTWNKYINDSILWKLRKGGVYFSKADSLIFWYFNMAQNVSNSWCQVAKCWNCWTKMSYLGD